jgi:ATPase family protein associated with various cellular activities (AAA)
MKLADQLTDYINAAFTGLWVLTSEPDEAEREITQHAKQKKWKLAVWDIASGIRLPGSEGPSKAATGAGDPLAALRALPALGDEQGTAILILHNFHRFLNSPEVVQTAFMQLVAGKQQRTFIVVLAPTVILPAELEKLFVVLEHSLPDREQLQRIAQELVSDRPDDMPKGEQLQRVLDASAGLTRYEAEGAFSLSLTRHNAIRPESIWELKSQTLRKNNLLALHRGQENFNSLGGLTNLKDFCRRALAAGKSIKARGVLLLGVSGTGKSAFAKALGNETGRPTLTLDIGSLMGSLVGQTEGNFRQALRIADAMSPCILFVDELEKALSGVGSQGDSGVSTRLFGNLLTWLSDHESDVFFVGTSNDISKLPPEFTRAERFDGVFFLDLPHVKERDSIWSLYRSHFGIPDNQAKPKDDSWTGAEIRACCRLAALLDQPLSMAARNIVPVAVTAAESVDRLRTWASGRCLCANNPGIFSRDGVPELKPARRVVRPSDN